MKNNTAKIFQKKRWGLSLLCTLLIVVFLKQWLFFCQPVLAKPLPRTLQILIVHSAYQGYPWTDSLNRGIQNTFGSAPESSVFIIEDIFTKRKKYKIYF
jgi:hypothetical protein